jgi:PAS domain S-box-containing protein
VGRASVGPRRRGRGDRCLAKPVRPLELVSVLEAVRNELRSPAPSGNVLLRWFVETTAEYVILTLDAAGRVASWNRGAERAFGYPAARVVGRPWSALFAADAARPGLPDELLAAAATAARVERSCLFAPRDGSRVRVPVLVAALRDPDGKLCGYGAITRSWATDVESEANGRG